MINLTRIRLNYHSPGEIDLDDFDRYYHNSFYFKDEVISGSTLQKRILNVPSTNGLYVIKGREDVSWGDTIRYLFATDEFISKLYNDEFINTMSADPKHFYRGKHVNIKVFVKKLLERPLGLVKHTSSKISSLKDPIDILDLSVRPYNTLKREGFTSIESLLELTFEEIKGTKNLGLKSAEEVRDKLLERGFKLKPSAIKVVRTPKKAAVKKKAKKRS